MVEEQTNGALNGLSGTTGGSVNLSTLPGPDHDWQVSLKDKVIASELTSTKIGMNSC